MNIVRVIISLLMKLFWPLLVQMRRLWDWEVDVFVKFVNSFKKKVVLPPVFNPLLLLPATMLAQKIRERELSSVEVVRTFVTRCSDVNPIINAIVQDNFQTALLQARLIDERINMGYKNGSLTREMLEKDEPFLGVPFTVKETISVQGFPHTAGLLIRSGELAEKDATIVTRMKDAGAILLATTNVSELDNWWECSNPLYGRTCNPYDTRRSSGGASGGEASLMCSCGTPISIGTDTGGSIRTPAFFCGLFGHKPTSGIIPLNGCNIHPHGEKTSTIQVAGPITRHVVDIIPVLQVLAGYKGHKLTLDDPVSLGRLQIFTMEDDGNLVTTSAVLPKLKKIQDDVAKYFLTKYDISASKIKIPDLRRSFWIWQDKMKEDYPKKLPICRRLADNKESINVWTEMIRGIVGRNRHSFASLLQAALEKLMEELRFLQDQRTFFWGKAPVKYEGANADWRQIKMRIQRQLGSNGILLYPSHPSFAPFHRESYLKPLNFSYTAIFNALGFPVTQVPLGVEKETGMPMGIQVVGGMFCDRLTIAVAKELEVAFGGWKFPGYKL